MKTYRTASSNEGLRLPHHGYVVGKLVEALRLKDLVKHDLPAAGRTVQRYFAGERVEPETVNDVLRVLVDGLVPRGIMLPDEVADKLAVHTAVHEQLLQSIQRWENLVGKVNSNLYPVSRREDLPIPVLRLVALDFGMRWGAWLSIRELRHRLHPDWDNHPLQSDTLRRFIDMHRGNTSVEALAQKIDVSTQTVEEWRGGGCLPTDKHIRDLAGVLAGTSGDRATLEAVLRLKVAAADVLNQLNEVCGQDRIQDMIEASLLTARRIHEFVTLPCSEEGFSRISAELKAKYEGGIDRLIESSVRQAWAVLIFGAACPGGEFFTRQFLVKDSAHRPEVAGDFAVLSGDWSDRVVYWMQRLATVPDEAEALKERFGERLGPLNMDPGEFATAALQGQMRMAGFDWKPGPEWQWFKVECPPDVKAMNMVQQAEVAVSAGDLNGAVEHLRQAVKHSPSDPVVHFRLGAHLGQIGMKAGRPEIMEQGALECRIAVQLDPEFGNARNEIAVILSNLGDYEEAETAYAEAEPYHGSHAHHWYGRGLNYLAFRKYQAAALSFRQAIDLSANGDHTDAKFWLAATLMAIGDTKAAKELGKKVHHLTGKDPTKDWQNLLEGWTRMGLRHRDFAN